MELDFTRAVTHVGYKHADKLKKYYHRVDKCITEVPKGINLAKGINDASDKMSWYVDDNFMNMPTEGTITPLLGGGLSLFIVVGGLFVDDTFEGFGFFVYILSCISFVFFTVYYFTKPNKEELLNRRDGLVTMPGFYWQKNITIPFKDCLFAYSTGGEDGTGAFRLEAIRPTESWFNTFAEFNLGFGHCYAAMSFICWYMDKNRPLPPGTAFDAYRERDYQRRKAAGFPYPLYPGITTPEATKAQQKERMAIGGW